MFAMQCTIKMSYPEFGHIGFKLLCAAYGYLSFQHMQVSAYRQARHEEQLTRIANALEALKTDRK